MNIDKTLIREIGIGVLSAGIATGITYVLTKRHYVELIDTEVASVKESYKARYKVEEYATPESASERLRELREQTEEVKKEVVETVVQDDELSREIAEASGYVPTDEDYVDAGHGVVPPSEPGERLHAGSNVGHYKAPVDLSPADEDDLPILQEPDDDTPYLIRIDQWGEDYDKHTKSSIVYFAGDKVLVDESEEPFPDIDRVVGLQALERFGEGSQDDDIVYVRNHRLSTDFEIVRDPRTFSEAVYGVDPQHIQHAMRFGDDG